MPDYGMLNLKQITMYHKSAGDAMTNNEKEYNGYLFDQLSAVERIEKQALTGDMEKVKEEIETLKKEINRKLYQKPPLLEN